MRRVLIFTILMLAMASTLVAQTIDLKAVGIKVANQGGVVAPGSMIEVKYKFDAEDLDQQRIRGAASDDNTGSLNEIYIVWYKANYSYYDEQTITVNEFETVAEEGFDQYKTLVFQLPSTPHPSVVSFAVDGLLYANRRNLYTYSDFKESNDDDLVDDEEFEDYSGLLTINTNQAPVANNVRITNPTFAKVGQVLTGEYNYFDADGDPQSGTTFRWLRSATVNGTYSAIPSATSTSYTVAGDDVGYYLKFEVTPRASEGTSPGIAVLSEASSIVTEAPSLSVSSSVTPLTEASSNNGSITQTEYAIVTLNNATFVAQANLSGITLVGAPDGLNIGNITRTSNNVLQIKIAGSTAVHEYDASILTPNCINFNIPANNMVGVSNPLQSEVGFQIEFKNNPVENPDRGDITYNSVQITWDTPIGLKQSGSGLSYFQVYKGDVQIGTTPFRDHKSSHQYVDKNLVTGTPGIYKIQAIYDHGGLPFATANVQATPMGFTAFSIVNPAVNGTINHESKTVSLVLPPDTDPSSLIANFTAPGYQHVRIDEEEQNSGSTTNDFSSPLTYEIIATDGSTVYYTVTTETAMAAPIAYTEGLNPTTSSINVAWSEADQHAGYILDIATDSNFSNYLPGYQNKEIDANISRVVINNLPADTPYYFRVKTKAVDESLNSAYSNTGIVSTEAASNGQGSTELNGTDAATINMGNLDTITQGLITPQMVFTPASFSAGSDNNVSVSLSYGEYPVGMRYSISFEGSVTTGGTFVLHYAGLDYDPTEAWLSVNGGDFSQIAGAVNPANKTISFTWTGGAKGAVVLDIKCNDEQDQTLPVVLSSFTAQAMAQGRVRLSWTTQSESGVLGYHVLRGSSAEMAESLIISPLIEATNTSNLAHYSYLDKEIPGNGVYYYWLQSSDLDGSIQHFGPIPIELTTGDENNQVPLITALNSPFPNPFNPSVSIPFDLAEKGLVRIAIYNTKGQLVKTLVDREEMPKSHRLSWDGKDNNGKKVASGSYIIRMDAGKYHASKKVVLLK